MYTLLHIIKEQDPLDSSHINRKQRYFPLFVFLILFFLYIFSDFHCDDPYFTRLP